MAIFSEERVTEMRALVSEVISPSRSQTGSREELLAQYVTELLGELDAIPPSLSMMRRKSIMIEASYKELKERNKKLEAVFSTARTAVADLRADHVESDAVDRLERAVEIAAT